MVASHYDIKSYNYQKAKDQARLDQLLASLVKREITLENNRIVSVMSVRKIGNGK